MIKNNPKLVSPFNRLTAVYRLLICLIFAILFYFLIPVGRMNGFTHVFSAWDIFSLGMILLSWTTFFTTSSQQMRGMAKLQDETRTIIFIIVLVSTFASLLAVLLLIISKDEGRINKEVHLVVAIAGMAFSWFLVHTVFTLRYAHLYYGDSPAKPSVHAGGLNFPEEEKPDYIDFAYFSFVIGMTFQVSDVQITSKKIRRLALLHGILSFGFNTIIVALTINVIAGLGKN
ncbi:MAG: DUF1345 domain-containing protein [Ginsengibacter sp.]